MAQIICFFKLLKVNIRTNEMHSPQLYVVYTLILVMHGFLNQFMEIFFVTELLL